MICGRCQLALLAVISWTTLSFDAMSTAADQEFDENAVAWQDEDGLRTDGLRAAEKFRLKLLRGNGGDDATAKTLGAALYEFRKRYRDPLPRRPTLERFSVTKDEFVKQLHGTQKVAPMAAFGPFAGRWYGRWDQLKVDHHWHDVVSLNSHRALMDRASEEELPLVVARQYAWIGNGFGWNFVVRVADLGDVVLGYVYLVDPRKADAIRFSAPLVGYYDGPGRLIWITATSVYFEEVLVTPNDVEHYAITGFNYSVKDGVLNAEDPAFQAVYTRHSTERPEWLKFSISMSVSPSSHN